MKATFFTNTMLLLEGRHSRILCDPWVTFDDTSTSGFYNFPRCGISREEVAAIRPDFIYITHTHPDHFDATTLSLFDMGTPVFVADYARNFTARAVQRVGFKDVRIVPRHDGLPLNGDDRIWLEPAALSPDVDSLGAFRLDGQIAVNANDNSFDEEQCSALRRRLGRIDVGLLPSGAHGPWPMFYENLTPTQMEAEARKREIRLKDSFTGYVRAFAPKWVVPIGGGIVCGGNKALRYNHSGLRPRSEVVAYALERVAFEPVLLSERNSFDFQSGERAGAYIEKSFATESEYLLTLSRKPSIFAPGGAFHIASSERIDLSRLLGIARSQMHARQRQAGAVSDTAFFFDVGEPNLYRLSLADDSVSRISESDIIDEEYEIFRLPYELLLGLLTRHYVWSNVNTQHMQFFRKGDRMDATLFLFINYLQI